ncbi:MAG TPA: phosphotransferase [Terrimicrobiaceae bacterium]|nr:phosphotransferase [Terrimicrobiaceae bacterium]
MSLEQLVQQTQEKFPRYHRERVEISPLEKGGSDRKFYRICAGTERPVILVKYSGQKEENRHYVDIAKFLAAAGVNVPDIYYHDPDEGLIWMQDLGGEDLWASRNAPWDDRRPLYESALTEAAKMHTAATRRLDGSGLRLEREFGEQLYLWEQSYFFDNCLRAHFGLDEATVRRYAELPAMQGIAVRLAALPRVLVHRDFQSQNILIRDGEAWLIDFQGMRPGLPHYDAASLLYDPYVTLSGAERAQLLEFYKRAASARGMEVSGDFDSVFHHCALQRLMQALGAYGFLGLQKGRPDFLVHIPAARRSLREVAARIDGLDEFVALLDRLP